MKKTIAWVVLVLILVAGCSPLDRMQPAVTSNSRSHEQIEKAEAVSKFWSMMLEATNMLPGDTNQLRDMVYVQQEKHRLTAATSADPIKDSDDARHEFLVAHGQLVGSIVDVAVLDMKSDIDTVRLDAIVRGNRCVEADKVHVRAILVIIVVRQKWAAINSHSLEAGR